MAKIMQGECNGKMWKRSFTKLDTAEPPLVLCKDNANERKESLLLISRVPLVLCKDNANEWKESLLLISRVQLVLCKDIKKTSNWFVISIILTHLLNHW